MIRGRCWRLRCRPFAEILPDFDRAERHYTTGVRLNEGAAIIEHDVPTAVTPGCSSM